MSDLPSRAELDSLRRHIDAGNEVGYDTGRLLSLVERMLPVVEWLAAIQTESNGITGFHLNGDVADWDEFEDATQARAIIEEVTES